MEQVIAPITQFMMAAAVTPHISITSDMYRTLATHCSFREGTAKGSQCKHQLARVGSYCGSWTRIFRMLWPQRPLSADRLTTC